MRKANPTINAQALHERIAAKAYERYEQRGRTHGDDLEDWLEAERQVLAELKSESAHQTSRLKKRVSRSRSKGV